MSRSLIPLLVPLLTVFALPQLASAQEPASRFGDQLQVSEVALDVLVNDGDGNVILGLTKDDFVIEENGKPVQLESVTFYSNRALVSSADELRCQGVNFNEVPQDRLFILFFDDQRSRAGEAPGILGQQMNAAQKSKQWVEQELLPGDYVAVVSYNYKLKLHQDFTQDRTALTAAIDRAMQGKDPSNWPSRIDENAPLSLARNLPQGRELRDATPTIYEALQVLSEASGSVQGRKNLLLFTLGFGQLSSFGQYRPDTRYYPPMVQALNDNNVAVYAIDLAPPGVDHTMQDAMNVLALDTGGDYLFNFNNFIKPLRRVSETTNGYYLLTYRSEHPQGDSGYQKVEVRTVNDELKVKAREGYTFGDRS